MSFSVAHLSTSGTEEIWSVFIYNCMVWRYLGCIVGQFYGIVTRQTLVFNSSCVCVCVTKDNFLVAQFSVILAAQLENNVRYIST